MEDKMQDKLHQSSRLEENDLLFVYECACVCVTVMGPN